MWEAHIQLKAIIDFQAAMEDLVRNSVDVVDQQSFEEIMYSIQRPKMVPWGADDAGN